MKPLVIPPAAQRDENAIQMLSAWIAEKGQHCTINIDMWQQDFAFLLLPHHEEIVMGTFAC